MLLYNPQLVVITYELIYVIEETHCEMGMLSTWAPFQNEGRISMNKYYY